MAMGAGRKSVLSKEKYEKLLKAAEGQESVPLENAMDLSLEAVEILGQEC